MKGSHLFSELHYPPVFYQSRNNRGGKAAVCSVRKSRSSHCQNSQPTPLSLASGHPRNLLTACYTPTLHGPLSCDFPISHHLCWEHRTSSFFYLLKAYLLGSRSVCHVVSEHIVLFLCSIAESYFVCIIV